MDAKVRCEIRRDTAYHSRSPLRRAGLATPASPGQPSDIGACTCIGTSEFLIRGPVVTRYQDRASAAWPVGDSYPDRIADQRIFACAMRGAVIRVSLQRLPRRRDEVVDHRAHADAQQQHREQHRLPALACGPRRAARWARGAHGGSRGRSYLAGSCPGAGTTIAGGVPDCWSGAGTGAGCGAAVAADLACAASLIARTASSRFS